MKPVTSHYPAISRSTVLEIAEMLGLSDPNDVESILIEADRVTVMGWPGTMPLILPVVDG